MDDRNEFAKAALTYVGMLKIEAARIGTPIEEGDWSCDGIARLAYEVADSMLTASLDAPGIEQAREVIDACNKFTNEDDSKESQDKAVRALADWYQD